MRHLPAGGLSRRAFGRAGAQHRVGVVDVDEDFARDFAQAILVSHLDMIIAVLDLLGVPHENGFFAKDLEAARYFTGGWEERVLDKFRATYSETVLIFYINHLRWELLNSPELYHPVSTNPA